MTNWQSCGSERRRLRTPFSKTDKATLARFTRQPSAESHRGAISGPFARPQWLPLWYDRELVQTDGVTLDG